MFSIELAKDLCTRNDDLVQEECAIQWISQKILSTFENKEKFPARFDILDVRHHIEDTIEALTEEQSCLEFIGTLWELKCAKKIINQVKNMSEAEKQMVMFCNSIVRENVSKYKDSLLSVNDINQDALLKEISKILEVKSSQGIPENLFKHFTRSWTTPITKDDFQAFHEEVGITVPPIVLAAYMYAIQTKKAEEIFIKNSKEQVVAYPVRPSFDFEEAPTTQFRSIKSAKKEPLNTKRCVIASKGHLLLWDESSNRYVSVPEPLAHLIANVPGLDLIEDRAMVFIADPQTKVGAIVYLRLFGPIKRVASFDLESPDESDLPDALPMNWINCDRDTQGNIVLTWGHLLETGNIQWSSHASLIEKNLVENGTLKRVSPAKIIFEDFADPQDRSGATSLVRQDFRDHGNVLGIHQKSASTSSVVSWKTKILDLPYRSPAIFGQPLGFAVAHPYRRIDFFRVVQNQVSLQNHIELDWPYQITGIVVV